MLAPINITRAGYPVDESRNFGPSGLSAGDDRWDVRWAVVLQGSLRERGRDFDLLTLWIDYQTLQPLYVVTKARRGGRLLEVGIQLHRFSGDVPQYPPWPDGSKANVFDPVGAVFFDAASGGSGWRRAAYDIRSVPRSEAAQPTGGRRAGRARSRPRTSSEGAGTPRRASGSATGRSRPRPCRRCRPSGSTGGRSH